MFLILWGKINKSGIKNKSQKNIKISQMGLGGVKAKSGVNRNNQTGPAHVELLQPPAILCPKTRIL